MDSRKKACPNESCNTYKKKKFNSSTNFCPECGTKLVYVCKSHKCFKPLEDETNHQYCFECYTKRKDAQDKAVDGLKKCGATVGAVVVVPFAKAIQVGLGKAAKNAGEKVIEKVLKK